MFTTKCLARPRDGLAIYVIGKQWMWKIEHPGGQREINQLHIPVDRNIVLTLTSQDVIHDFDVPAFRIKHDVLPGRYVRMWFKATHPGTYRLFCGQYCGDFHSLMDGQRHRHVGRRLRGVAATGPGRA